MSYPNNYRRSTVTARTRRRGGPTRKIRPLPVRLYRRPRYSKKYTYVPNPKNYKDLKMVNKRRQTVALPNLEMKRSLKYQSLQQWTTATTSLWSHVEELHTVAEGDDNESRESNHLRFLPGKLKIRLQQPASTEFDYRILVIKRYSKGSSYPTPSQVLSTATNPEWFFSTYKPFDDYASTDPKFKVISDFNFRWNTNAGNSKSTLRKISIPYPAANVEYDEDQTDGTFNKNSLFFCVLTNATSASASHTISYQHYVKFLDR